MTREQYYEANSVIRELHSLSDFSAEVNIARSYAIPEGELDQLQKELQEIVNERVSKYREAKIKELEEQLARI